MSRFSLAILLLLILAPAAAWADTIVFSPLRKFVSSADLVAIVQVAPQRLGGLKPLPNGYTKSTDVHVLQILKGEASADFTVFHGRRLSDHLFQQNPGRYLVFLKRTGDEYTPLEGFAASKFILDGDVTGWSDAHSEKDRKPLSDVIAWIQKEVRSK